MAVVVHDNDLLRSDRHSVIGARALSLVLRLHREGTLSEGQCCTALDLDRVAFRILADAVTERTEEVFLGPRPASRLARHQMNADQFAFLGRFVGRGWLAALRDDPGEQAAIDAGLRKRWLRREAAEVHFTLAGRRALEGEG